MRPCFTPPPGVLQPSSPGCVHTVGIEPFIAAGNTIRPRARGHREVRQVGSRVALLAAPAGRALAPREPRARGRCARREATESEGERGVDEVVTTGRRGERRGERDPVAGAEASPRFERLVGGEARRPRERVGGVAREEGRDAVFDVPPTLKDQAPADPVIEVALTMDPAVRTIGRVREVSPRADPVTGTFRVKVGLDAPPPGMRLGSTVTGRLELGGGAGIDVPASALTRQKDQMAVWVVDPATQTVALRPVEVLRFDPARVLVGQGLEAGEVVVTAGVQALRPGQKVRLLGSVSAAR
jgi:hypothetical protein